jgi:hypothetical protein
MKPCQHTAAVATCHFCRLYETRPDYRWLWDHGPKAPPPREKKCIHLGAVIEPCPTGCKGKDVYDCDLHDRCTLAPVNPTVADCAQCDDYQPEQENAVPSVAAPIAQAKGPPVVDIITLFSGRWYAWHHWLESFRALQYPVGGLRLFAYSNTDDAVFLALLSKTILEINASGIPARLTIDPALKVSRNAHRELGQGDDFPGDHCDVIAALYNRVLDQVGADSDLFFFEDDLAVPPDSVLRLQAACQRQQAGYAVGVTRDRHNAHGVFIWDLQQWPDGTWTAKDLAQPIGLRSIGLGPLGCTYVPRWAWQRITDPKMKPYPPAEWKGGQLAGCDMILCLEMERLGIKRLCDFDLKTRHYDSKGQAW